MLESLHKETTKQQMGENATEGSFVREVRLGDTGEEHQVINKGGKPDSARWD